jgi:hypothetical protein
MAAPPEGARTIVRGILRLARFNRGGFAMFDGSVSAFLSSLAPLVAFPLVGGGLWLLQGGGTDALTELFATLSVLLAPAVLSHAFARFWRREPAWLRYAVAFNWCQWAIPLAAVPLMFVLAALMAVGLTEDAAATVAVLGLLVYGLSLHWFLARHGLQLSVVRATVLVIGVNLGTTILVMTPRLLALALGGPQDG